MRIHINTLILLEEKFGTFDIGNTNNTSIYCSSSCLALRFGYWRQVPAENLQSMLRSIMIDSSIIVEENLVDEDEECGGELYNYIIYSTN